MEPKQLKKLDLLLDRATFSKVASLLQKEVLHEVTALSDQINELANKKKVALRELAENLSTHVYSFGGSTHPSINYASGETAGSPLSHETIVAERLAVIRFWDGQILAKINERREAEKRFNCDKLILLYRLKQCQADSTITKQEETFIDNCLTMANGPQ